MVLLCLQTILPSLLDHINVIVEDYFPALLEPDIRGHPHLTQHVPCPVCLKEKKKTIHCFSMPDILQGFEENVTRGDSESCVSQMQDLKMQCPYHSQTSVEISELVCDVTISGDSLLQANR